MPEFPVNQVNQPGVKMAAKGSRANKNAKLAAAQLSRPEQINAAVDNKKPTDAKGLEAYNAGMEWCELQWKEKAKKLGVPPITLANLDDAVIKLMEDIKEKPGKLDELVHDGANGVRSVKQVLMNAVKGKELREKEKKNSGPAGPGVPNASGAEYVPKAGVPTLEDSRAINSQLPGGQVNAAGNPTTVGQVGLTANTKKAFAPANESNFQGGRRSRTRKQSKKRKGSRKVRRH
jgi:hypothetical protein